MSEWNPELYLRFEKERTLPVHDLISHIDLKEPKRILDIGCGTGTSTRALLAKWPNAEIMGTDNSKTMIEAAKKSTDKIQYVLNDADKDPLPSGKYDLIFSNAAIQWVKNTDDLLKNAYAALNEGGAFAAQMPYGTSMLINIAMHDLSNSDKWISYFRGFDPPPFYREIGYYYDAFCTPTNNISVWETHYNHIMPSHKHIVEWYKSTGMKPFLDNLSTPELQEEFEEDLLTAITKVYNIQKDGNVLFPFRRLFIICYK